MDHKEQGGVWFVEDYKLSNDGEKLSEESPLQVSGIIGNAQEFDGDSDIIIYQDASLRIESTLTVDAWIKSFELEEFTEAIIFGQSQSTYRLEIHENSGVLDFKGYVNNTEVSTTATIGEYTHITMRYDGNSLRLYVNGNEAVSESLTDLIPTDRYISFLMGPDFNGIIDEVRVSAGGSGDNDDNPVPIGDVVLESRDEFGNPSTVGLNDPQTVYATLENDASDEGDAELGGVVEKDIQSGTATFVDLTLDKDGTGFTLRFTSENPLDLGYVITEPFNMTGVEDYSGFEVEHPGPQVTNVEFNLEILNATDKEGNLLNGDKTVTITSSNLDEGTDGELFTEEFTFTDGKATIPTTLVESGMHDLTIEVTGVTEPVVVSDVEVVSEDMSGFNVDLAEPGKKYEGIPFDLAITAAMDVGGHNLNGEINITVTTDQVEGEVYNGEVVFSEGEAVVTITLEAYDVLHNLEVSVSGITDPENVQVEVIQDLSEFSIVDPGTQTAGVAFDLDITGAKDLDGLDLSGDVNVIVTTDIPGEETEGVVYDGQVTFTDGGAKLGGTTEEVDIKSGTATFNDLTLDRDGEGFTLIFSSDGLSNAETEPFNMTDVEDYSGFDILDPGPQVSGESFDLEIVNAREPDATLLEGSYTVSIESNQETSTVFNNNNVTFSGGTATVNITLDNKEIHELTVTVNGMTENISVTVSGLLTWTGLGADNDWNTQENWEPESLPDGSEHIRIPDGGEPVISDNVNVFTMDILSGAELLVNSSGSLTIDNGGKVVVKPNASLTAEGALTNSAGEEGLIIESSAEGTGSVILNNTGVEATVQRYMKGGGWYIVSPPVTGQSISEFILNDQNDIPYNQSQDYYAITHYNEGDGDNGDWAVFYKDTEGGNLVSGESYLMRRRAAGSMIFRGTLAHDVGTVAVEHTKNGWNSIGNPFPSALKVRGTDSGSFIWYNAEVTNALDEYYAALYVYDHEYERYRIINNNGAELPEGKELEQDYIKPGQGFIVKAADGGGNVEFTTAMRDHQHQDDGIEFKSHKSDSQRWPTVILSVSDEINESSTVITFNENMTEGLDVTYDAGLFGADPELQLFTRLVEGDTGVDIAIQCLPDRGFNEMVIPVGVDYSDGGEVTFSTDVFSLPDNTEAVLEDSELDIFTNLEEEDYTAYLSVGSNGTGRFFLHIKSTLPCLLPCG